ncbi:putative integral membrane protein [Mycolicibacterium chubuense NBB4]|uniref:Putative integral membrane protein n=1 Tax=Mycolicibacterium chubuense (strain NBB4) TaxID=710421 RepID=I4BC32_MYCCN|nr:DUF3566 domain-containing protein [Mycolicibacterium chubuense]AFM14839.1 putative integral membrane protein [Mycolicibacterium chubuense NBB4]
MSSPNEPGYPRTGEGSGGANGSAGPSGSGHGAGSPGNSVTQGGPPSGPAHGADHGDVPPWQRGPAARARQQQAPEDSSPDRSGGSGLDARLNRFMSGGAPAGSQEAEHATRGEQRTETVRPEGPRPEGPRPEGPRPEGPRPEGLRPDGPRSEPPTRSDSRTAAYASELPDLSGPMPRPPQQQRKPVDRPAPEQPAKATKAPAGRAVQVAPRPSQSGPVRASMQIRRFDPWSVLKISLVLSVALFFVWMIAVAFLYLVLGGMGVWSKLNSNVGDLLTSASGSSGGELVSSGTIFGGAALIGLVNIVLLTAAATIGAFIYNLTTDLVGGVEVTLADRD